MVPKQVEFEIETVSLHPRESEASTRSLKLMIRRLNRRADAPSLHVSARLSRVFLRPSFDWLHHVSDLGFGQEIARREQNLGHFQNECSEQ